MTPTKLCSGLYVHFLTYTDSYYVHTNTQSIDQLMDDGFEHTFSKEVMQRAHKYMGRCSRSVLIGETPSDIVMSRHYLTSVSMLFTVTINRKLNVLAGVGRSKSCHAVLVEMEEGAGEDHDLSSPLGNLAWTLLLSLATGLANKTK